MKYLEYFVTGIKPKNFFYISTLSLKNYLDMRYPVYSNHKHISSVMSWLSLAQKQTKDGGVSSLYSLFKGWLPSYIETTGYIIPTFFNYAEISKNQFYRDSAIQMAEFELKNQLSSGAFPGAGSKNHPIVFNTGQVIFGLCKSYVETGDKKFRDSAKKAADWLVSVMDKDGCWRKYEYLDNIHTYNTRTAWALLYAHKVCKKNAYKKAAEKNIGWALTQQLENGWFHNNGFYPEQEPLLHTIAYTIRGILEAALYLKREDYLNAAVKSAIQVSKVQYADGSLPGSLNKKWKTSVAWSCLTGNSQMSIIWQKLSLDGKNKKLLNSIKMCNNFMKSTQNLFSLNHGIRGAIPGAYPIYGWYAPFCYPNWAAKFFADSLILESHPNLIDRII
jgi:hypothetical protein